MNRLSDHHLIAAYMKSIELGLDSLFINMLKQEINRRKLDRIYPNPQNNIEMPKKAPC
jgi:Sporulation inhibitor A